MKNLKTFGLVLFVILLSSFTSGTTEAVEGYDIGDYATDFKLKNVDGKMVSLADFEDAKGFLVIFTCNTCPYAVAYEDRIIALDKKYKEQGVPVIAINPNNPAAKPKDDFAHMQRRAREKGFTFPYLLDEGQKIYPKYGATRTPHVFLLEKTGKGNKVRYIGTIDDNYARAEAVETKYVEDAIDAMLAGESIPLEKTRAIGCSIKV
ncbi:thioredoxin family protein [Poritiphilus flavus]|uniref:Redoxin domain-containing protein n=1 Tax=Poritiphilus flavus TaxID=2697053 RepID=A0A6L9EAJ6_9FLAO|nr:thioredoxin family protein [Poritiphilus flavus]NAS11797.1 redoxin domain-containing protein [Poritiphilus flavus]